MLVLLGGFPGLDDGPLVRIEKAQNGNALVLVQVSTASYPFGMKVWKSLEHRCCTRNLLPRGRHLTEKVSTTTNALLFRSISLIYAALSKKDQRGLSARISKTLPNASSTVTHCYSNHSRLPMHSPTSYTTPFKSFLCSISSNKSLKSSSPPSANRRNSSTCSFNHARSSPAYPPMKTHQHKHSQKNSPFSPSNPNSAAPSLFLPEN